jgi:hypothetical protein
MASGLAVGLSDAISLCSALTAPKIETGRDPETERAVRPPNRVPTRQLQISNTFAGKDEVGKGRIRFGTRAISRSLPTFLRSPRLVHPLETGDCVRRPL